MYEIFEELLKTYDMTIYKFCKETGVSESTIYTWKKKRTQCSAKLQKIVCDYFGVSADYLLTGEEQQEIKMKPGVNIVDRKGNVTTFDINSLVYTIMESIATLPPESQEMIYDVAEAQKKRKKVIYVENPHNKKAIQFPTLNAAHERTDIDVPKNVDTSEDDIMDDENF